MATKTLLQKAKQHKGKGALDVSDQEIELAMAWCRGEIGNAQVSYALGKPVGVTAYVYVFVSRTLRTAIITGRLVEASDA